MQITIQAEKYSLSSAQESYIKDKLESLKKYYEKITDEAVMVRVNIEENRSLEQKQKLLMRVSMVVPRASFRAEVKAYTVEEGIDLIHDKLLRQVERYKTKHLKHDSLSLAEFSDQIVNQNSVSSFNIANNGLDDRIVKRKLFTDLIPMTESEALDTMLLLGHTFFIFVNISTDRYNIIYTRKENDGYGLVELEQQEGVIN